LIIGLFGDIKYKMIKQNKIDYRKEVIPVSEARRYEMIGKVVVIKTYIEVQVEESPTHLHVWADIPFHLYVKWPWHNAISKQLYKYEGEYSKWGNIEDSGGPVYLRGQIYFDEFWCDRNRDPKIPRECFVLIRPVRGIPFIVGDTEQYF